MPIHRRAGRAAPSAEEVRPLENQAVVLALRQIRGARRAWVVQPVQKKPSGGRSCNQPRLTRWIPRSCRSTLAWPRLSCWAGSGELRLPSHEAVASTEKPAWDPTHSRLFGAPSSFVCPACQLPPSMNSKYSTSLQRTSKPEPRTNGESPTKRNSPVSGSTSAACAR
jgi:hypothetical protein